MSHGSIPRRGGDPRGRPTYAPVATLKGSPHVRRAPLQGRPRGASMKAIVVREFGKPEVMKLEENAPDPAAGPGDVLVRMRAAGVNPVDAYIHTGTYVR